MFVSGLTPGTLSLASGTGVLVPPAAHQTDEGTDSRTRRPSARRMPDFLDLTQHLQDVVDSFGLAGMAVGIVKENEVVYARGFGFENALTRLPITPSTLFHTASISKTFVATAVMQLAEQGRIGLDDHLIEHLSYFALADDRYREITIKQMLIHTSGFPDVEDYEWESPQYDDEALERYVRSLSTEHMIGDPGATWAYSNMAYDVLGDVIAKSTGMLFEEYEKERVLEAAGMLRSDFLKPEDLPSGWASPHVLNLTPRVWQGYPYHRAHAPSSTLHSNVLELCQWALINLNHGTLGDHSILHTSTYSTLWQQHATFPMGRGLFHSGGGQGIAWAIGDYKGDEIIGHAGSDVGFTSILILVPQRSIAVVMLCTSANRVTFEITGMLLDAALGYPFQPLIPPASITVCKTLEDAGLNAAVEQWNRLQRDHPDEYDFGADHFYLMAEAILERGTEGEATLLACLFRIIMPEDEVTNAINMLLVRLQEYPEDTIAEVMLNSLRDGLGCARLGWISPHISPGLMDGCHVPHGCIVKRSCVRGPRDDDDPAAIPWREETNPGSSALSAI
ncbi:MAG: class A beta-lactamase-related serine hydrolase [Candidatus Aminicenantes bacterium]|nr:MAG: class A beta-lactamase-related serine hydrolase [Candidatus Aminicenantes bacterium]